MLGCTRRAGLISHCQRIFVVFLSAPILLGGVWRDGFFGGCYLRVLAVGRLDMFGCT